jgi:hypothetical protein
LLCYKQAVTGCCYPGRVGFRAAGQTRSHGSNPYLAVYKQQPACQVQISPSKSDTKRPAVHHCDTEAGPDFHPPPVLGPRDWLHGIALAMTGTQITAQIIAPDVITPGTSACVCRFPPLWGGHRFCGGGAVGLAGGSHASCQIECELRPRLPLSPVGKGCVLSLETFSRREDGMYFVRALAVWRLSRWGFDVEGIWGA